MGESILSVLFDAHRARRQGVPAIAGRQRNRLREMVDFARVNSPYYRQLYRHLPERIENATLLPVTNKQDLMRHFDDWVTDRDVTFPAVRAFVDDTELIGQQFLGRYSVATTSGSTGTPGIFLLDRRNWAVTLAFSLRMMMGWLSAGDLVRLILAGGRTALIQAMGGHYIGATSFGAIKSKRAARRLRAMPAQTPLRDLVVELNQFRPALLAGYASIMALLAGEQETGRLHIQPVLVHPSSEGDYLRKDMNESLEPFTQKYEPFMSLQNAYSSRRAANTAGTTSTAIGLCSNPSMPIIDLLRRDRKQTLFS
jgi:phenylacetate-CoA ligase